MSLGKFVVGFCAAASIYAVALVACTPSQRAIVKTIIDIANVVCGDGDDTDTCLLKMQGARAAEKAGTKHDVSTAAPAPVPPDAGAEQ